MFFTIIFTILLTAITIAILPLAVCIFFRPEDTKPSPQIEIHTMWTPKEKLEKCTPIKKTKSKK